MEGPALVTEDLAVEAFVKAMAEHAGHDHGMAAWFFPKKDGKGWMVIWQFVEEDPLC